MTTIAPPPPAPPTATAPPPLTPGARTTVRALLVVAASVLIMGCVAGLAVTAWGIQSVRVSTEGKDLPDGMRALVIDASDATVHVKSDPQATTPRVDLRALNSTGGTQQRLAVTTDPSGTRIVVSPDSHRFMDFARTGEVTVTLPPRLAGTLSVTVQQGDGTLLVDADLDRLVARNTDGNIVLNGAAHLIEITAKDGNVVARKPLTVTESFVAESVDGNVDVVFDEPAPRRVEATTQDGNVTITLPATGPYLVRTQSSDSASVRVPETNDPARAVSEVTVRSDDGNVVVDTHRRG